MTNLRERLAEYMQGAFDMTEVWSKDYWLSEADSLLQEIDPEGKLNDWYRPKLTAEEAEMLLAHVTPPLNYRGPERDVYASARAKLKTIKDRGWLA